MFSFQKKVPTAEGDGGSEGVVGKEGSVGVGQRWRVGSEGGWG